MLYNYSVTPLKEDNFDARVQDICDCVKRGAITMPLFCMTLVPEGDPVWDKAGKMVKLYSRYRDALDAEGVPSGILVQASLGHGYKITPAPFDYYVNLTDGAQALVCCPEDERFLAHFQDVLRTLAAAHPKALMLDDDFRLMMRPGRGCACRRHMAEFNRRAGTSMTREELYAHLQSCSDNDPLAVIYAETQRDSLIRAATAFRAAIDEIDPSIQGINCTSGNICESVSYTNKIFAGRGNPTMVRIPNGIYAPYSIRGFSDLMARTAVCTSKLKKNGIDIILSETDTIPFNRYAKSARYLHSHYTVSMLDGLCGAKHWLTRTSAFEPASGKAYRDILAKHKGFYEKLTELAPQIRWVGANSAFTEQMIPAFGSGNPGAQQSHFWVTKNLEEMGIPFYFSDRREPASFLEGNMIAAMSDEQIETVFAGSVFLDGATAAALVQRGFGDRLGVTLSEWDLGLVSGECFDADGVNCCTAQKNYSKITVSDPRTEVLSHLFRREDGGIRPLAPAVTKFRRDDGKITVVFCGSPCANFSYTEGFAFLNESRKAQLTALLQEAGALPVYAVGDDELCLRAGYLADGSLLCAVFQLGMDPMDALTLHLEKAPAEIRLLLPDGTDVPVEFTRDGNCYILQVRVETLYPVVLIIR